MNKAVVLPIGSEVVSGSVVDTNSKFIAWELSRLSFEVLSHHAVRDRAPVIREVLEQSLAVADLVIVTGGLGPTFDDITKRVLADFFGRPLKFNARQYARIRRYFHLRQAKPRAFSREQATFPSGGRIFDNNFGVAPGIGLERDGKWVIALPGVPREMEGMFREEVLPFLKERFKMRACRLGLEAKVVGIHEVDVLRRLGKKFPPRDPNVECGIYPSTGEVTLRMTFCGGAQKELAGRRREWMRTLETRLGKHLVGFSDEPLEKTLGLLLARKRQSASVAESVTGGLIAKRMTDIEGSSRYVKGGVVVYSDEAKERVLGVPAPMLKKFGAVSSEVAKDMARRVREKFGCHWGVSTTGWAGAARPQKKEPIGTVFVGLSSKRGSLSRRFRFFGGREKVRWLASQAALAWLREKLLYG
ncbi:MAG: CinA family nicotinamide mononucleotide deamidase-related protein [Candidatus Omnitrophica bacterium]|nr:CinA family nicotinamide mononucleotide deamidase-related protein [Candidatus Omnitrophota bacterium]